jgi:oligoribonuclease
MGRGIPLAESEGRRVNGEPLLWVDFETTGTNPQRNEPLEVAAILTTPDMVEIARFHAVIAWTVDGLVFDDIAEEMHRSSGLLDEVDAASKVEPSWSVQTAFWAGRAFSQWLDSHVDRGTKVTLCGSGVAHFDRYVIKAWFPAIEERLTYFMLDVGHIRRFMKLAGWNTDRPAVKAHRAMADIEDHLAEAREIVEGLGHLLRLWQMAPIQAALA